jgi:hypothetical protein
VRMQTLLLAALIVVPVTATAQSTNGTAANGDPAAAGLAVAREWDKRDSGFGAQLANLKMVLRNRHGEESTRQMRLRLLEMPNDGDRSLVVFDQPGDVAGTALLSFSHRVGSDDQWLYLPALRRVKRIASNNKAGPFMGSEFAYEDVTSQEVEKYDYSLLGTEALDGKPAFVVERLPVDPNSGYKRQVAWYDSAEYRVLKVDYYDRRGGLLKTLTAHDWAQHGRFWRPGRMEMVNHQTGKSTVLLWSNYELGVALDTRDFDQAALERVR